MQFNIYDPVKIRSHPGVRSDLFRRPVRDALVTDFFGGVSQAEVLPPPRAPTLSHVSAELNAAPAFATRDDDNATDLLVSIGELDAGAFVAALGSGPQTEVGSSVVRKVRTWTSSVGVLVLAGWVASRRK